MAILTVLVFAVGLATGSFLNVVILRGSRGERLGGRSYCESCHKRLSPRELIPVLSYILQKGRCRRCGAVFSAQHPLVELATGVCFVAGFYLFLPSAATPQSFLWLPVLFTGAAASIIIFVSDIRFKIIPDGAILPLFLIGAIAEVNRFLSYGKAALEYDLAAALFFSAIFAALWLTSGGRWMGLGDAKLFFAASLILGYPFSLTAFLFSFWLGGLIGAALFFFRGKKLKSEIPFGPFILAGSLLAYFLTDVFLFSSGIGLFMPVYF